ncbi:MAG: riboflavin synthase [Nitrospirae bacterium]|nr:riboflavin synthase [Nitrospirota bacterium]MCL5422953.1 riboflavin synthase [Nitrospirota bacterium]
MFTGIIVELGEAASLSRKQSGASLAIAAGALAKDAALGDSIAINGACLTVVSRHGNILSFDLSDETLRSTNLGQLKPGDRVNLEPSLKADGKLGGHFVTGHVDAVGRIRSKNLVGNTFEITVEAPEKVTGLLVEKGSIALDGISLTVVDVSEDAFSVVIIPHTARLTTIGFKSAGATVNLEADIIGKYVARFLNRKGDSGKTGSDRSLMKSLIESGYIKDAE